MFDLIKKHFTCPEIDRFEGVDFETFINLESDAIKEVIPEVIPRLNFITQYKNYLRTIDLQTIIDSEIISDLVIVDNTNNEFAHPQNHNVQSTVGILATNELNVPGKSSSDIQCIRSINSAQDIIDIPSIELKIIIERYTQKRLDNSDRVLVGKEIIRHLLLQSPERVITREEFEQIAGNIVKLFPNEIADSYYTAAQGSVQVQGKLYTAYNKLKARLREVGLITKRPKSRPRDRTYSDNRTRTELPFDDTVQSNTALNLMSVSCSKSETGTECELKDPKSMLNFLSVQYEDFEKVKRYWVMSHKYRSTELLPKMKTLDYVNMFPAFNQPKGYELISIDASMKFTNMKSKLLEVSKNILLFAAGLKNRSSDVKILTNEFNRFQENNTLDRGIIQVQQQLIALRLIPHLLKSSDKRKRKCEGTHAFYTSYQSIAEAEEKDKHTTDALPYLYMIGESTIPESHLVISGKKFVIQDPIEAFDLLFKSYVALSLNYPDEWKHVWLFIQKSIYNVHKDSDLKLSNVSTLINDISKVSNA